MHKWSKEILECLQSKIKAKGLDNIDLNELEESVYWSKFANNIAQADYYCKIVDEMEKPENQFGDEYDENGPIRRGYRGRNPYNGQYVSRPYTRMMDRDMDMDDGRMYYTDTHISDNRAYNRGYEDGMANHSGTVEKARRGYETAKETGTHEDRINKLNEMMNSISEMMAPMLPTMDSSEKTIVRNGLQAIQTKLS